MKFRTCARRCKSTWVLAYASAGWSCQRQRKWKSTPPRPRSKSSHHRKRLPAIRFFRAAGWSCLSSETRHSNVLTHHRALGSGRKRAIRRASGYGLADWLLSPTHLGGLERPRLEPRELHQVRRMEAWRKDGPLPQRRRILGDVSRGRETGARNAHGFRRLAFEQKRARHPGQGHQVALRRDRGAAQPGLEGHLGVNLLGNVAQLLHGKNTLLRGVAEQIQRPRSGHELDVRERLHVRDQSLEILEGFLALFRSLHRRELPLLARRVQAAGEVHGVPELPVDKFTRVKIQADDSAFGSRAHARIELLKFRLGVVEIRPVIARPELGPFLGVEDVEQASVPEGLALEPDVRGLVEIDLDAPVLERAVRLRRPRIAGLAVAGGRRPENAAQVIVTRAVP